MGHPVGTMRVSEGSEGMVGDSREGGVVSTRGEGWERTSVRDYAKLGLGYEPRHQDSGKLNQSGWDLSCSGSPKRRERGDIPGG